MARVRDLGFKVRSPELLIVKFMVKVQASPNVFLRLESTGPAGIKRRNLLNSDASSDSPSTACLEAEYSPMYGAGRKPSTELTLTILRGGASDAR